MGAGQGNGPGDLVPRNPASQKPLVECKDGVITSLSQPPIPMVRAGQSCLHGKALHPRLPLSASRISPQAMLQAIQDSVACSGEVAHEAVASMETVQLWH